MVHEGIIRKVAVGEVSWKWSDQSQGLVEWTFMNTGKKTGSFVLVRGAGNTEISEPPYVFGTAFNAMYLNNSEDFGTQLMTSAPEPLTDNDAENNSPPMAYVVDSTGKGMIAFIFTLSPGQVWNMLEGGFTDGIEPQSPQLILVTPQGMETFCWAWNSEQCEGYNQQSGSNLPCPKNPWQITTMAFSCTQALNPEFTDTFTAGECGATSSGTGKTPCLDDLLKAVENHSLEDALTALSCIMNDLKLYL